MPSLPVLVFDVNETLLDLDTLAPHFDRIFGTPTALRDWFAQLILYSQALTLADHYVPFGELGGAALTMLGEILHRPITTADRNDVRQAIAEMPPHADTIPALRTLAAAGFRLVTLTNNPKATCIQQLKRGGLLGFFEQQFSIDEDQPPRYKPAPSSYRAVERALNLQPSELCLIACHTWDTLGATAAGWDSALVLRSGNAPLPVGPQPIIVGHSLTEIAATLIDRYAE